MNCVSVCICMNFVPPFLYVKQYICTWFFFEISFLLNFCLQRLGVEILVSGFVFEKEDFIRPWEGRNDNLERYNSEYCPSMIKDTLQSLMLIENYSVLLKSACIFSSVYHETVVLLYL